MNATEIGVVGLGPQGGGGVAWLGRVRAERSRLRFCGRRRAVLVAAAAPGRVDADGSDGAGWLLRGLEALGYDVTTLVAPSARELLRLGEGWFELAYVQAGARCDAGLLRQVLPATRVVVENKRSEVLRAVAARPTRLALPFAQRLGVGMLVRGRAGRRAARHLVGEVMPLVWRADPALPCRLAGDTAALRDLAGAMVAVDGVDAVGPTLEQVRVTAALGPGADGRAAPVLASLARRTPCAMTAAAARGVALTPALRDGLADGAEAMARRILHLHGNAAAHRAAARSGAALLRRDYSEAAAVDALAEVIGDRDWAAREAAAARERMGG